MKNKKWFKILIYSIIILISLVFIFRYLDVKKVASNIDLDIKNYEKIVKAEENQYIEDIYDKNEEAFENTERQSVVTMEDIQPHTDPNTGVKYVTYEDFGAKYDEGFDNYQIIKNTHAYANQYGYEVRATANTYHIYNLDDIHPILIYTNTNWNGANFIIHDENIKDKDVREEALFKIDFDRGNIVINDKELLNNIKINKGVSKIPQLAGYGNCICFVYNSNKKQFIRTGDNYETGSDQSDIFKIDNEGNVLNEIQWDFDEITMIRLIPIIDSIITVQNGNFKTILNGTEQESGYFNRNIICYRSNTIIKNITHTVDDTEKLGGPYYGFIRVSHTANVTLEDCKLYTHKYKNKSNYDLILENSVNIAMDNVTSNDIEDIYRWGITGTNYTKDITYKNCVLNRIDAHCGVYNLNIENSIIGCKGITVVGGGKLNLSNVISSYNGGLIELRTDYGSTWNGNINIEDCTYKPTNSNQIIRFAVTYDDNKPHDYGYDLHLPNINISNLKIEDENNTNNSCEYYIFNNTSNNTGTENGDMRNAYILPKNVVVNNYSTTSGRKIKLFSNKFYNNLSELGINFSLPLKDKEEVKITDKSGNNIGNNDITNQNIKIEIPQVEGIETTVEVNDKEIGETETQLTQDNDYKIDITYKNSNGEVEDDIKNIVIDKTPPSIIGMVEGGSYKYRVTPKISDKNLKEIKVLLNGQVLKNYKEGDTLEEEGNYQLTATDKAGNNAVINFSIEALTEEDYMLDDKYIKNINNNTTKTDFVKKFEFNEQYDIYRNDKILAGNEIIATGDILRTSTGTEYTLIVTGDINEDGDVNIKDIVKLRKYILSKNNLNAMEMIAADTNLDGKDINIKDLVKMRIIVLNKEIV